MFSRTYLRQPATQRDSVRLRNRLAAKAWELERTSRNAAIAFVRIIHAETGARVPEGAGGYDIGRFFRETEFRDVLDGVTCMVTAMEEQGANARMWVEFCKRAFDEEAMAYSVDDHGGCHYRVDVAFHETAASVVASLSVAPFVAAGAALDNAVKELTRAEPQGKHAIRDAFEGLETLFKVVTGTNHDLTVANIGNDLMPIVSRKYDAADPIAQGAAEQSIASLKDWTNACHRYRHGHQVEEPVEPPLELAVLLVSNGLGFARWIADLRQQ